VDALHKKTTKDAITGDTLRLGGNNQRPADFRMGQPSRSNVLLSILESIEYEKLTW